MAKLSVTIEVEESNIPKALLEMALDHVINGPMNRRYGSMAQAELLREYGEVAWLAAKQVIEPFKAELALINAERQTAIATCRKAHGLS